MKPITKNTKSGIRVRYVSGPTRRFIGRLGVVQSRRDGMLMVEFDAGHDRAAEYYGAWPSSLERVRVKSLRQMLVERYD